MDERAPKKQKEPPMDRAARITAKATVWIAFFTFVSVAVSVFTFLILKSQLREMHDGGIDTHNLAVAAGKQAEAARDQARLLRQQMVGTMGAHIEIGGPELINNKLRILRIDWLKSRGENCPKQSHTIIHPTNAPNLSKYLKLGHHRPLGSFDKAVSVV